MKRNPLLPRLVFSPTLLCAAWLALAAGAHGQSLLNVDFGAGGASAKTGFAATGRGTNDFWNQFSLYKPKFTPGDPLRFNGTLAPLKFSDGSDSSVTLAVANAPGVWGNATGDPMFDSYIFPHNGSNLVVTLTGLGPGRWHFYLYGHAEPDAIGEQNSVFMLRSGTNALGPLGATGGPWRAGQPWQEGRQFVVFREVESFGSEPVVLEVAPGPGGVAVLNGLQILSRGTSPPRLPLVARGPLDPSRTNIYFHSVRYEGRVMEREARFAVTIELETAATNETSAAFFSGDLAVIAKELPPGLRLVGGAGGYRLFASAPGKHTLTFDLLPRVTRADPWNEIRFTGPAAAIASLNVKPDAKGLAVQLQSGAALDAGPDGALGGIVGPDRQVALRWQGKATEVARKALLTADTKSSVRVSPTVARFTTEVRYEILQAPVPRLRLALPDGHALTRIQGAQIRDWETKPDGGRQVLTVEFIKPVEKSAVLTLLTEQALDTAGTNETSFAAPEPLDVTRETGRLEFSVDDVTFDVAAAPGLRQVNAESGSLAAWRFSSRPARVAANVRRIEPELDAFARVSARLEESRLVVTHDLALSIARAGIYTLDLRPPADFKVAALTGDDVEDWRATDGAVKVSFRKRALGGRTLRVVLERSLSEFPKQISIGPLAVAGAKTERAQLSAGSSPGIALKTASANGLREIPVHTLAQRGVEDLLAFNADAPGWSLALDTERLAPRVLADVLNLVTIGDGIVGGSATIRFGILNQGVQSLRVRLPAHWKNVEFTGPNIRRKELNADTWTITLQDKAWGGYTLVVTYDYPFDPAGGALDLAGAHTPDAERETGSLGVMTAGGLQLDPPAPAMPLRRVDEADWAASDRALATRPLLLAFKYTGTNFAFTLPVRRFDEERVLDAVADRTELTSVLTAEGQMLTQAKFMVKNNEKQSQRFKLPAGSELWAAHVNGQPVKPERDGDWLLISLPRESNRDQLFAVDLIYREKISGLGGAWPQGVALTAPLTDVPNTYAEWELFSPPSQRLSAFAGNMTVQRGTTYDLRDAWDEFVSFYGKFVSEFGKALLAVMIVLAMVFVLVLAARRGYHAAFNAIVVLGIVGVLASMMLPALNSARSKATRGKSMSNLRQVALAARVWANDNKGYLPPSFEAMNDQLGGDRVLVDPQTGQRFVYVGSGKRDDDPSAIVAYTASDVNGRMVAFADGSVQQMPADKFQEALARDAQLPRADVQTMVASSAYASPNTTGQLSFAPAKPGVDPSVNLKMSGISAGGGGRKLAVTATSSNPSLIPATPPPPATPRGVEQLQAEVESVRAALNDSTMLYQAAVKSGEPEEIEKNSRQISEWNFRLQNTEAELAKIPNRKVEPSKADFSTRLAQLKSLAANSADADTRIRAEDEAKRITVMLEDSGGTAVGGVDLARRDFPMFNAQNNAALEMGGVLYLGGAFTEVGTNVGRPVPNVTGMAMFDSQGITGATFTATSPKASGRFFSLPTAPTLAAVPGLTALEDAGVSGSPAGQKPRPAPTPVAAGIRALRIEIPRAGQQFNFTKVLNTGNEPLAIEFSVMRLSAFRAFQMAVQVLCFLGGLALAWAGWRRGASLRATLGLALALGAVASLALAWRLLGLAFIASIPMLVLAVVAWLLARWWQRRKAAKDLEDEPGDSTPPAAPPVVAAILLLLAVNGANAQPQFAERQARQQAAYPVATVITNATLVSARYTGDVREKAASFQAVLQLQTTHADALVPLFGDDVAAAEFKATPEGARLLRTERGLAVLVPKPGAVTLEIKLLVPVLGDAARRNLDFRLPPALASQVSVTLDEAGAEAEFPSALSLQTAPSGERTRIEAVLGAGGRMDLAWTPRMKRAAEVSATVLVENETTATASPGVLNSRAKLNYTVSQGELRAPRVRLPAGHRLLRVEAEGLRTWTLEGGADEGQTLVVELTRPVTAAWVLTVETEQDLAADKNQRIAVPHALDVQRETGRIALKSSEELSLTVEAARELQRVDVADAGGGAQSAYRFLKPGFELAVRAQLIEPQIEAVTWNTFTAGAEQLKLDATARYVIRRAGVFMLRLALPENFRVDKVAAFNARNQRVEFRHAEVTENGARRLEVSFKERQQGGLTVQFELVKPLAALPASLDLAGAHPLGAEKLTGFVIAKSELGLALKTGAFTGLTEIPASEVGVSEGGVLAFKFIAAASGDAPPWRLAVAPEALEPWVRAEAVTTASVGETFVSGRTVMKFNIANAPVKEFRLRVPGAFTNVDFAGAAIRRRDRTNTAGGVEWRLELQQKVSGDYPLTVTWELPRGTATNAISLAAIEALNVERETGFVTVARRGSFQISEKSFSTGMSRVDVRELPDWAGKPDLTAALTYKCLRPGWTLAFTAQRHREAEVLAALADNVRLMTVVADDGQTMTELKVSVRHSGRQHLGIELPPGAKVWSAFVAGQPVRPRKSGGKFLLPLEGATGGDAVEVEVIYVGAQPFPKRSGRVGFVSPKIDAPVKNARWDLFLPPDYEYTGFGGSMAPASGAEVAPLVTVFSQSEYAAQEQQKLVEREEVARRSLKEAEEQLGRGNLSFANSIFQNYQDFNRNVGYARDEDASSVRLNAQLKRAQASNLLQAQEGFYFKNVASGQSDNRGYTVSGVTNFGGGDFTRVQNAAAEKQWEKVAAVQEVRQARVAPLRVSLPTRGARHTFTQALQTEAFKPMTIEFAARHTRAGGWFGWAWRGAAAFAALWALTAWAAARRGRENA